MTDVVTIGPAALQSALRAAGIGRIFAVDAPDAPLEVVRVKSVNGGILLSERDVAIVEAPIDPRAIGHAANELRASDRIASITKPGLVLLRRWVINVIGALDDSGSLDEWKARASRLGLRHDAQRMSFSDDELLSLLS